MNCSARRLVIPSTRHKMSPRLTLQSSTSRRSIGMSEPQRGWHPLVCGWPGQRLSRMRRRSCPTCFLLSTAATDLIDGMLTIEPERRLEVTHTLQSPWVTKDKLGMGTGMAMVDRPVYRSMGSDGITAADLDEMYAQEGSAEVRPVYRGGPPLGPPPALVKQKQMFCDDFHLRYEEGAA